MTEPVSLTSLLAACLLLAPAAACCADTPPLSLPEANAGLAATYPGGADVSNKWDVVYNVEHMTIAEDPADVNGGRRALEITVPKQSTPLSVDVCRTLAETHDVLFLRFYTKFQEGFEVPRTPMHNGGSMSARYYPGGVATPGKRADGRNKVLASFETPAWRPGLRPTGGGRRTSVRVVPRVPGGPR